MIVKLVRETIGDAQFSVEVDTKGRAIRIVAKDIHGPG
jgi:hypothetical protein